MTFILPSIGSGIIASPTAIPFNDSYSVSFDGSDDHASTNFVTDDFDLKDGFTVSLWVNLDSVSGTQDFFGRYGSSTSRFYFGISGSNLRVAIGTSFNTTSLSHGLSTGSWSHVAYTFTGGSSGTFTYYVNGSSVGTLSFTWTFDNVAYEPMHIGALKNGANTNQNPTNGKLDEMAIFNSALSSSDISSIYNSGVPNDISSLNPVGWWRMGDNDGGTGTTITDQGSGGNDATLTNGPTFSTDVPSPLYSVEFDGTNDHMDCSATFTSLWSGSFSISLWLKTSSSFTVGVDNYLGNDFVPGQGYIEFRQRQTNSSSAKIEVFFGNSVTGSAPYGSYGAATSEVLSTDRWYHLVLTADRPSSGTTTATLYVDGSATTLTPIGGYLSSLPNSGGTWSNNTLIAARNNASSGSGSGELNLDGHLDEIAFFNSVLSSSNVTTIYNSGVPNDISSLSPVNWWRMGDNNSGSGTTITDQGSAGNDGTLTNGPTFSTTVP